MRITSRCDGYPRVARKRPARAASDALCELEVSDALCVTSPPASRAVPLEDLPATGPITGPRHGLHCRHPRMRTHALNPCVMKELLEFRISNTPRVLADDPADVSSAQAGPPRSHQVGSRVCRPGS